MAFEFDGAGNLVTTQAGGFHFDEEGNLLGEGKKDVGGFAASAKQAIGSTIKGAGQIAADFIPGVDRDNAVSRYGQEVIDANPTAVQSLGDIADKPGTAVAEAAGNAVGSMGRMLGARALGMGITAAAPLTGPAAPLVAGIGQAIAWLGPAAIASLPSYGSIRDKQILNDPALEDDAKAKAVAALGAAAVGAIETMFGPQEWALSAMTKEGRELLAKRLAETGVVKGLVYGAGKGAVIEGAEELAQNPVEQLASYDDPRTPENLRDTAFGGAMGAIGGGVLGGGMGFGANVNRKADVQDVMEAPDVDTAIQRADEALTPEPMPNDAAALFDRQAQGDPLASLLESRRIEAEAERAKPQPQPPIQNDPAALLDRQMAGDPFIPMLEDRRIRTEAADAAEREAAARREAELSAIPEIAAEQDATQAALERAGTLEAPTAMQLALERAKGQPEPAAAPSEPAAPPLPRLVERTPEMVAMPQKLAEQRAAADSSLEVVRFANIDRATGKPNGKFAFTVVPKAAPANRSAAPSGTQERADAAAVGAGRADAVRAPDAQTAAVEPVATWFGRRGDGYLTEADAGLALPTRERVSPELSWRIERMPSGKFRLAGYEREGQNAGYASERQIPGLQDDVPRGGAERAGRGDRPQGLDQPVAMPRGEGEPQRGLDGADATTAVRGSAGRNGSDANVPADGGVDRLAGSGDAQGVGDALRADRPAGSRASEEPAGARDDGQPSAGMPAVEAPDLRAANAALERRVAELEARQPEPTEPPPATDQGTVDVTGEQPSVPVSEIAKPKVEAVQNPTGTVTLKGEPEAVRSLLSENGLKAIQGKSGFVVGKSQAQKALEVVGKQAEQSEPQSRSYAEFTPEEKAAYDKRHGIPPGRREEVAAALARQDLQALENRIAAAKRGQKALDAVTLLSEVRAEEVLRTAKADLAAARAEVQEAEEREAAAKQARALQPLDHGELNIPGRTNNIDRELDRYKADQEKARKAEAKIAVSQRKANKARAKELFDQVWPAMREKMGPKFGEKQLRETLDSMVKWEPAKFIALAEKFQKEQGGGFDSTMRARGHEVTQTPEFKRWFGDSKVVDAEGRPLVVYHGTAESFNRFDKAKVGSNFGADERGFFFTSNPQEASSYAENDTVGVNKRQGANIIPVHLSLKKPLVINPAFLQAEGMGGLLGPGGKEDTISFWDTYQSQILEWADERKSDGIIIEDPSFTETNGEPRRLIVAFKPTQIKSAIGNRGTFDANDADITHARDSAERRASPSTYEEAMAQLQARKGAAKADVQAIVDGMASGWNNGPKITVVQHVSELPGDNPPDVRGMYQNGRIYVVAGAHRNGPTLKRSVARTLAHEAVAHYGLRTMLGREGWNRMMASVQLALKTGNKPLTALQQQVREAYVNEDGSFALSPGQEADEIAAKAVEEAIDEDGNFRPGFGMFKAAWAKVAQFLRDIGINVQFTNAELQGMLVLSMRNMEAGQRTVGGGQLAVAAAREDGPMQGRGTTPPVATEKDVAGTDQGGRSAGDSTESDLTAARLVDSPEFHRWFAGSKVVDAKGRPLLVFHGALDEFEAFDKKHLGTHAGGAGTDTGFFFTSNEDNAKTYAEHYSFLSERKNVVRAYLRMERPHVVSVVDEMRKYLRENASYIGIDDESSIDRMDYDELADHYMPEGPGDLIRQAIHDAKVNGSDGVILRGIRDNTTVSDKTFERMRWANDRADHYIVFDPDQIRIAGREFLNEPTASAGSDAPKPDNKGAQGGDAFDGAQQARSAVTGQALPNAWQAPDDSRLDSFIYSLQDKHIDTKRVVQSVREAIGQLQDQIDPYLQEELYHGRAAKATKDFLEQQLKPLLVDMQARGVEMSDFEEYLHNRHAERRNIQVAKVNEAMPDGGSGIKTADARKYLANLPADKRRAYEALAKRVDAITADTRKLLVDSGLEKQTTIAAWEAAYGNEYVPLMREEMEDGTRGIGQGYSVKGPASKRAMGSNKPVADIIANIALQRERTITRAEKKRVGEALYGLVLTAPNDNFWYAVDPALNRNPSQIMATQMQLISLGLDPDDAESIAQETVSRYIDKNGQVAYRVNPAMRGLSNVVAVRIDGEDKFVFFNTKDERALRMVTALKNLDADQLGVVMGNVAKMTRYFSAISTQYNPVFGVVNLTRDVQTALLNLNSTPLKDHKADVMKHVLPALRGIYIDLRDHRAGKQPSSVWAGLFEGFQKEGGATGYRNMYSDAAERADAIRSELRALKDGSLMKLGKGIMGWLSDYNEAMENAVRVATYKVGKEQGLTNEQAASVAKNLTVNFNRKGQVALQAGALYAFFNASVQGSARMAQTMFEGGKLSAAGKRIITGGLLLGSMQALLLAAAGYDDDEPPDFVRERSLIIPLPGKKYMSIPMPLGFHVIPNLARIPTEWAMSGFKKTPQRLAELFGVFADAFNPVGSAGLSLQTITPTVVDPLAALAENKDWTGKPIAKKDFNSLRPTAGHTRAKDTATPWARAISYGVNIATGGTDYKPGLASPTPDQIDYLIGQIAGGVGREASKLSQVMTSTMSGEDLPLYKVPLVGRFVGTTEGQAAEASRFYENLREIGAHKVELDGLRKDGKGQEMAQYIRDNPQARLVTQADKIARQVSALNKLKRDMVAKGAPKERVKAIEEQITGRMAALNRMASKLDD